MTILTKNQRLSLLFSALFAGMLIVVSCNEKNEVKPTAGQQVENVLQVEIRGQTQFFAPFPNTGCPNKQKYLFRIIDEKALPVSGVLFTTPYGEKVYKEMARFYDATTRKWEQRLETTLQNSGRYLLQYVINNNNKISILSNNTFSIDNTNVYLTTNSNSVNYLYWSFGSDGSSWSDRKGWIGGQECRNSNGSYCAYGHGVGTHTAANSDYYADDWNKSTDKNKNADAGAIFNSPLDGKVVNIEYRASTYGNMVDIQQEFGDKIFRFRIAHLSSISVKKNDIVFGGITPIGIIGRTGQATNDHAHCVLYEFNKNGKNLQSLPFVFQQNCQ